MKWFLLAYWLFGCVLVGDVMRNRFVECPTDPHPISEAHLLAAILWPAYAYVGITLPAGYKFPPRTCKGQ
jgi:hypothetical protein